MTKSEVDEAFEWMVIVIGIVSAIMIQYPEYFFTLTPGTTDPELKAAKAIVIPLTITIIIWLIAKLALNQRVQVFFRLVAWIIVLFIAFDYFYQYTLGLIWASGFHYETTIFNDIFVLLGLILAFGVPPAISYFIVIPRYKQIYPDSMLLNSKSRLLLLFLVMDILLFLMAMGITYS